MSSITSLLRFVHQPQSGFASYASRGETLPMPQCFRHRFPSMNQPRLVGTVLCIHQVNEKAFLKSIFLSIHLSFAQRELFTTILLFLSNSMPLATEKSLTKRVHSFRVLDLCGFHSFLNSVCHEVMGPLLYHCVSTQGRSSFSTVDVCKKNGVNLVKQVGLH